MDTRRPSEDRATPWFEVRTDPQEINHHMRRAQQMRAEAMAEFVTAVCSGVARLGRAAAAAVAALVRGYRQRATARELMAYDNRKLDELGLRRSDIPAVADGQPVSRPSG